MGSQPVRACVSALCVRDPGWSLRSLQRATRWRCQWWRCTTTRCSTSWPEMSGGTPPASAGTSSPPPLVAARSPPSHTSEYGHGWGGRVQTVFICPFVMKGRERDILQLDCWFHEIVLRSSSSFKAPVINTFLFKNVSNYVQWERCRL